MPTDPKAAGEIVTTRRLPSPRERVWRAFCDAAALAAWWGPVGFTNTFHEFGFRPGGTWRFTMRGPDGTAYEMSNQFTEITPPGQIVLRHNQQGHGFTLVMTLAAEGAQTCLTWRMTFDDPVEQARVYDIVTAANEQNLDRLEAHLAG